MTEEMKYYTGNCITDLHTDTSISCNEEKCKQYIKSGGLNFCMSSVCPEKDCIYALVNKLHQKIDCLEQENKELLEARNHFMVVNLKYFNALEEIRDYLYTLTTVDSDFINTETYLRINDKINEVLNHSDC